MTRAAWRTQMGSTSNEPAGVVGSGWLSRT